MSAFDAEVSPEDVSDAADNSSDSGSAITSALSSIAIPPTTAEAQSYARKILDRSLSGASESGEQSLFKDLQSNAEGARAALRQARARLLAQQIDPQENRYAQAAAFLAPTRTGTFGENLSNYARTMQEQMAAQRQLEAQKAKGDLDLSLQQQGVDDNLLNARMKLQQLHEQQQGALANHALTTLGRSISAKGPGAAAASPFGKIAADEGLSRDSPEYIARVHELAQADLADKKARAGTDAAPVNPEEKLDYATQMGVPADVPTPWSGKSTKTATSMQEAAAKDAQKRFDAYPAADAQTQAGLRAIDEFQALNAQTHTGPELAPKTLGGVHVGLHGVGADAGHGEGWNVNPLSWFASFKPNIQRMDKLSSQLTSLAIPEKGFGRVTNMDMGIFQKGMLGTDKDKQTNDAIAQALKVRLQNDLDRHEFEQNFYQVHGHTNGAEAAWNKYLNDNPIFDPASAKTTHPQLNPNRQSYRDYFAHHNQKGGAGQFSDVTDEDRQDPVFAGMTDEEIHGAKQPAKAAGGAIGYADGGAVEEEEPEYRKLLNALKTGATFHALSGQEDKESPGANFGLEAAGGAGTVAALLALARRTGASRLVPKLMESPTTQRALLGAGAGAVAGGASSQDADPTLDILGGGTSGALLGSLAGLGAKYGIGAAGRLADKVTGQSVGPGERRAIEAITSDNPDWNSVASNLRADARAKIPSTLADIGPRTQGLAASALTKDTPQTADFARDLAARQAGANTRVGDQINQALKPDPYLQQEQNLKTALYSNAKPLYDQAYAAFPAVKSQKLMELMNTPSGQEAAARAVRMMQDARVPIGQADATGMIRSPSLQYLDYVKRGLDDMINREEGSGINYQATSQGRILRQMRGDLVNEVDQATQLPNGQPGPWQQARAQYGGDLEVLDALRSGRDDFARMTPEDLKARVGNMSYAERDAFRSGVAEGLFQKLGNSAEGTNPAKKISSTPALQDKLGAIFDQPSEAVKFLSALDRESDLFEQSKPLLRAAGKAQADSVTAPSLVQVARGHMMSPGTASEIADTLSAGAGPEAQAKIQRLQAAADRLKARADLGNSVGLPIAAGAAIGAVPTPNSQAAQ